MLSDKLEPLYTVEEVRQLLKHKTLDSVYRLLKREGIGNKIGKQIYVKEHDLLNLIDKYPLKSL